MSDYGKGDKRRPFDRARWDAGWDRAFRKPSKRLLALAEEAAARQAKMTKKDREQAIARIADDVKDAD